ncbi:MAG: VUT family protein [Legionella sp.]|nr:VUT family protein [Legionella sp.]
MASVSTAYQSRNFLPLTVAMMTCLILLINVSFKIVVMQGMLFTVSSVLCPIVAGLYLLVLKDCDLKQQRQVLNQSLLALYVFSVGIYLLVNLPAAENMRDSIAYQIIFEDVPRKFFSATLGFAVSFYLPHLFLCSRKSKIFNSPKGCMLLALLGGFSFFAIDFFLLFSDPKAENFMRIYIDSGMVATSLLLTIGISYLSCILLNKPDTKTTPRKVATYFLSPIYHYLIGFSVTILMICLACEYRLISFTNGWILSASGILFPLTIMASNLVGELYGYKANLRMIAILLLSELAFDLLLMIAIALPAPDFFDLNPFYSVIMPRRIPAATLALFLAYGSNALLLEKLKNTVYGSHRALRIFIANILANSLLCLVNYTILFVGIYPYEQIFNFAISSWTYKFIVTLLSLPLVLWIYKGCKETVETVTRISEA